MPNFNERWQQALTDTDRHTMDKMLTEILYDLNSNLRIYADRLSLLFINKDLMTNIDDNSVQLLHWLPGSLKAFSMWADKNKYVIKDFDALSAFIEFSKEFERHLENEIQLVTKRLQEVTKTEMQPVESGNDVKLFCFRSALFLMHEAKERLLPYIQGIANSKELHDFLDYFNFNSNSGELELKELFGQNPWSDLGPTFAYFDIHMLENCEQSINKLQFVTNTQSAQQQLATMKASCLPGDNEPLLTLKDLLDSYHNIDKTNPKHFSKRRKALISIELVIKNILDGDTELTPEQVEQLNQMKTQAMHKAHYIRELPSIKTKAEKRVFRYEHNQGKPLVVDKPDWFSDLDPCHRKGNYDLFNEWKTKAFSDNSTPDYWSWLEGQSNDVVNSFSVDERYKVPKEEKEVTFKKGICHNNKCGHLNNHVVVDGVYLYNIDKHGKLFILPTLKNFAGIGPQAKNLKGKGAKNEDGVSYNHNSVLNGESVMCAGCVYFVGGKIVQIDTNSGHFQPTMNHLRNALSLGMLEACVFAEDAMVTDYDGNKEISVNTFTAPDFVVEDYFSISNPLTPEDWEKINVPFSKQNEREFSHKDTHDSDSAKSQRKNKILRWARSIHKAEADEAQLPKTTASHSSTKSEISSSPKNEDAKSSKKKR